MSEADNGLRLFVVAGEASGDQLGAKLLVTLKGMIAGPVTFSGIGGPAMSAAGLNSLFPASDIAVMGPRHIASRLPLILRRLREATRAAVEFAPDILIVIDSPEFTQRLARRLRKRMPDLVIIKYVAPQVWAWRTGRARKMRGYIDHVLALLPFEPAFYARVGGPATTYVGHAMIEDTNRFRPNPVEMEQRGNVDRPRLVVLPGSRISEVTRHLDLFASVVERVAAAHGNLEVTIPAVAHLADAIKERTAQWPLRPTIVEGDEAKLAAFRSARAALAASGTVTLELALSGVPMVVAYRIERWLAPILARFLKVETVVLANLVLGARVVPEFLQWHATVDALSDALLNVLRDGPARQAQLDAFARLDAIMSIGSASPSQAAARAVLSVYEQKTGTPVSRR